MISRRPHLLCPVAATDTESVGLGFIGHHDGLQYESRKWRICTLPLGISLAVTLLDGLNRRGAVSNTQHCASLQVEAGNRTSIAARTRGRNAAWA